METWLTRNAISVDVIKRLVDKLRKLKITALLASHLGCTGERQRKALGSCRPCSAGAHTGEVGLIREQKFSCIFEIPPGESGQLPAKRSPGTGWESSISTSNQKTTGKKEAIPVKWKQVKKPVLPWTLVAFGGGCLLAQCKNPKMTETLGHGETNSAQPRTNTQMGGHSQCATATGNSASENPPRFSEMPVTSRAIYCQSVPLPIACLRRPNPGNMPYMKCS